MHVIAGVVGVAVAAVIIVLVLRLLVVVCEKKNNQKVVRYLQFTVCVLYKISLCM